MLTLAVGFQRALVPEAGRRSWEELGTGRLTGLPVFVYTIVLYRRAINRCGTRGSCAIRNP